MAKVTITDISNATGLSLATVSRILNHDPNLAVPDHTRAKVIEAARSLGYKKRKFNRSRRYKSTRIGIVQWYSAEKELLDPFYLSIRIGVENTLNKNNTEIVRFFKDELDLRQFQNVDGLICIGKFSKEEITTFRKTTDNLIFIDMNPDRINVSYVTLDFKNAVYDALNYLHSMQHKQIGLFTGVETIADDSIYEDSRKTCFIDYCKANEIVYIPYMKIGEFTSESGYNMMKEMINSKNLPTALFCASDPIAVGVLRACAEFNIKVPEDLSIISFNNDSTAAFSNPPLTTMHAPCDKMGEVAALTLINMKKEKKLYPRKITFPCELVIRQSCAIAKK